MAIRERGGNLLSLEGKLRNFGGTVSDDAMIVWLVLRGKVLVVGKVKPYDWERDAKWDYDVEQICFQGSADI
jgi:hypothetical protein